MPYAYRFAHTYIYANVHLSISTHIKLIYEQTLQIQWKDTMDFFF